VFHVFSLVLGDDLEQVRDVMALLLDLLAAYGCKDVLEDFKVVFEVALGGKRDTLI
jgi:hypothetical protein